MKQLLSKRHWHKPIPQGTRPVSNLPHFGQLIDYTQQRMLDEYYPTSHDIYDHALYPDIPHEIDEAVTVTRTAPDGSTYSEEVIQTKTYIQPTPRTAVSYQQMIETKRTDHLTGNDTVFNRNWQEANETKDTYFQNLVDAWEQHDMEDCIFQAVHNCNIVADVAAVQYIHTDAYGDKQMGWNVYSFFKGDDIYAHRDPRTGDTLLFARVFTDDQHHQHVEVWDSTHYYLFSHKESSAEGVPTPPDAPTHHEFTIPSLGTYALDGYILIQKTPHACNRCPVAYHRNDDGPVWAFSQDTIEAYEEDLNGLRQNNKAYGNPILVTKGDDVAGIPELDGTIKNINMGKDDDAKLLQGASASESYITTLNKLEELIYIQSFIVKTPELKSGDLPAAALKIIYSPAVEKAMHEVKEWQPFINEVFSIFRYYMGIIDGKTIDYAPSNLPIKVFLQPYVHQSESIMVNDLAIAVQNKFMSRQTASERIPWMAEESEWSRIVAEEKQAQQADLLYQTELATATTESPSPE